MKKMLLGAFLGMFAVAGIAFLPNYANAGTGDGEGHTPGSTDQFGKSQNLGYADQDISYSPDVYGVEAFQQDNLIKTIQTAINWVLGILSLIALALCLWGGFQMMTSGGDQKKYESGLNLLKWAAIGLGVIAVSWLVVSLIFYVINTAVVDDKAGTPNEISG